jgi:hypothetical protein
MERAGADIPDWRDASAYQPLLDADRALLAWEWLRRDPAYRAAAALADRAPGPPVANRSAAGFGLVAFERPGLPVPIARPVWRSRIHPFVLAVERTNGGPQQDRFDLDRLGELASLLASASGEHLLLSDGRRALRLDGPPGTFTSGPVRLGYRLNGLAAVDRPLATLRRFLALCRTGRFSRSLNPPEPRARRWVLLLRAWDGLGARADQRELARQLLSGSVAEPRWRSRESSVRSRVQRLARSARAMADGEYIGLLR